MTVGSGLAIIGIWLFAAVCAVSKNVTSAGFFLAMMVALAATLFILGLSVS